MTRNMWIIGSVCALALAVGVYSLLPSRPAAPAAAAAQRPAAAVQPKERGHEASAAKPARARAAAKPKAQAPAEPAAAGTAQADGQTPREQAVEKWDELIDALANQAGAPTAEQAQRVKESLHKLDPADRLDGVQNALNLLPDEQFTVLYPVLFDKAENPEILDAIFSDALNRDEELKVPLMKELYKDKTHPMFAEAARILDATGELDAMKGTGAAATAAPTP